MGVSGFGFWRVLGAPVSCGTEKISGHKTILQVFTPVLNMSNVDTIDAGQVHAACVSNGRMFTWGNNTWGQLGHSSLKACKSPKQVVGVNNLGEITLEFTEQKQIAAVLWKIQQAIDKI